MALTPYIQNGRMVFFSDLVLAISVHDSSSSGFERFLEANRSRIHEEPGLFDRAAQPDYNTHMHTCIVLLTFPPPKQHATPPSPRRSHFILGRDADTCDVVFDNPSISKQHITFSFDMNRENGALVIEDVSSTGSNLVEQARKVLWKRPVPAGAAGAPITASPAAAGDAAGDAVGDECRAPPPPSAAPKRARLIPGWTYDLEIPGVRMQFKVERRWGLEREVFERKRDEFIDAGWEDGGLNALAAPRGLDTTTARCSSVALGQGVQEVPDRSTTERIKLAHGFAAHMRGLLDSGQIHRPGPRPRLGEERVGYYDHYLVSSTAEGEGPPSGQQTAPKRGVDDVEDSSGPETFRVRPVEELKMYYL